MMVAYLYAVLAASGGLGAGAAAAQATITLAPMVVENYRVLQRVSRNAGWGSTAYKNYLVGLFEGLLIAESAPGSSVKAYCLPAAVRESAGRRSAGSDPYR